MNGVYKMTLTKLSTRRILAHPECDYLNAQFLRNVYRAYMKEKIIDAIELYQLIHGGSPLVLVSRQWSCPRVPERVVGIIEELFPSLNFLWYPLVFASE